MATPIPENVTVDTSKPAFTREVLDKLIQKKTKDCKTQTYAEQTLENLILLSTRGWVRASSKNRQNTINTLIRANCPYTWEKGQTRYETIYTFWYSEVGA